MLTIRIQSVFDKVESHPPLPYSAKVSISLKVSTKKLQWLKKKEEETFNKTA